MSCENRNKIIEENCLNGESMGSAQVSSEREKFIWNTLGSLSNAFASLILTICVNRIMGADSGGIFALAYSNAQLMLTISAFEVRNYQATDITEKYTFSQYFTFRLLTCAVTIPVILIYILQNNFSLDEAVIVFSLGIFKIIEAFADVYGGRFQQKDRIDISGKLLFIRVVVSTVLFVLLLYFTKNLVIASIGMMLTSFALFFLYDYRFVFEIDRGFPISFESIQSILKETFPLFVGAFIMMYISNAPKYAINDSYTNTMQNVYNILFMPAFIINLFSSFVFRPLLTRMAIYWKENELKPLLKIIIMMYIGIIGFTFFVMIAAGFLGIPILSFLYATDLSAYRIHLIVVMFVGGVSALMSFSNNVLVVMRKQKVLIPISIIAFVFALVAVPQIVKLYAIAGAIVSYGISIGIIVILYNFMIIISFIKRKNGIDR